MHEQAISVPVSDELYRTFLKTFQSLDDPIALAASPLLAHPLVVHAVEQAPGQPAHLVLKALFTEILEQVEAEKPVYADLLRGRFWEGQQIEEMLTAERPLAMSRRSFSNYQRSAIQTFAYLFLQTTPGTPPAPSTELMVAPTVALAQAPPSTVITVLPIAPHLPTLRSRLARWSTPGKVRLAVGLVVIVIGVVAMLRYTTSIGAAPVLFEDDFEMGAGKWRADSADWTVRADEQGNHSYCVQTSGDYTYALTGSTTWRDYILQMDLKILRSATNGSGNVLWRVSEHLLPFYEIDFFANNVSGAVLAKETSAYQTLDTAMQGFPEKEWVSIRVTVQDAHMAVFVGTDPNPILQATDATPLPQGAIGLGAGFPTGESNGVWEICFDNIRVTAL